MGDYINEKSKKNKIGYYFALCTGIGIVFGVVFNHLPIGVCLGAGIGLILDNNKKSK